MKKSSYDTGDINHNGRIYPKGAIERAISKLPPQAFNLPEMGPESFSIAEKFAPRTDGQANIITWDLMDNGEKEMGIVTLRKNELTGAEVQFHDSVDTIVQEMRERLQNAWLYKIHWGHPFETKGSVWVNAETTARYYDYLDDSAKLMVKQEPFNFGVTLSYADPTHTLEYRVKNNPIETCNGQKLGKYRLDVVRPIEYGIRRTLIGDLISRICRVADVKWYKNTDSYWLAVARVYVKAHLKLYEKDRKYYEEYINFEVLDKMCSRLSGYNRLLHITDVVEAGWSDPVSIIKLIHRNYGRFHFNEERGIYFEHVVEVQPEPMNCDSA